MLPKSGLSISRRQTQHWLLFMGGKKPETGEVKGEKKWLARLNSNQRLLPSNLNKIRRIMSLTTPGLRRMGWCRGVILHTG